MYKWKRSERATIQCQKRVVGCRDNVPGTGTKEPGWAPISGRRGPRWARELEITPCT